MLEMKSEMSHPRFWAPFVIVGSTRLKNSWNFLCKMHEQNIQKGLSLAGGANG
jgi:hypothetical protein